MVLNCIIVLTTKGQKVLHSCAQLLLTKPQQLPLKYSDFQPVAFHSALHRCWLDLQYGCCNWNMLLAVLSSFQSSIFQVFVTLTIWSPTSVLAKACLSPTDMNSTASETHVLYSLCLASVPFCINSALNYSSLNGEKLKSSVLYM